MRSDRSNSRNIQSMKRREFLQISSAMMGVGIESLRLREGVQSRLIQPGTTVRNVLQIC
jgi:hypothetical protein